MRHREQAREFWPLSGMGAPKKEKAPIEDPDLVGTGIGALNVAAQKRKASLVTPGRTFLQEICYHNRNRIVKNKMRYCKLLMVGTLGDPLADIDATINKVKGVGFQGLYLQTLT